MNGLLTSASLIKALTTTDLAPVDAFHIRGWEATLELAGRLNLHPDSQVFDLGSGLGGPARTVGLWVPRNR